MKICVFSDIHGRKLAMEKILQRIEIEKPDCLFLLGDYLYNGPRNGVPSDYDGMAVCEMLKPLLEKAVFVRGNCDAKVDEMVLGCLLPLRIEKVVNGRHCVLAHGDELDPAFLKLSKGDIFFSGHTHIQVLEEKDGIIYVNPGSTSFPKGGNEASYATFEEGKISLKRLSNGSVIASMDI